MKPPEAKAKFLFETLEPAHILEYVPEQSSSVHDFWIVRDGVRVAALEATSAHTPAMTRAYAAILDERKGGSFITGSLITQGWWIHPAPSANINRIRLHADRYLADVERDGLASFDADFQHDDAPSVAAIIADLGVRSGRTFSWTVPRQIAIALPGQFTWQSSDHALNVVREIALLEDNRAKLGRAPVDRRVLLIEVAHTCYDAWAGITSCKPPTPQPDLPSEVTEVWLVASIAHDHIIWRWDSERGWRSDRVSQALDLGGRAV